MVVTFLYCRTMQRNTLIQPQPQPKEIGPRVSANVVATYLNVKLSTVYSLCKGVRGWNKIKPLPHFTDKIVERSRYTFDLAAVQAWREETNFKLSPQGRGRKLHERPREAAQAV